MYCFEYLNDGYSYNESLQRPLVFFSLCARFRPALIGLYIYMTEYTRSIFIFLKLKIIRNVHKDHSQKPLYRNVTFRYHFTF